MSLEKLGFKFGTKGIKADEDDDVRVLVDDDDENEVIEEEEEANCPFNRGDIVTVSSLPVELVVLSTSDYGDEDIYCGWFDHDLEFVTENFPASLLKLVRTF